MFEGPRKRTGGYISSSHFEAEREKSAAEEYDKRLREKKLEEEGAERQILKKETSEPGTAGVETEAAEDNNEGGFRDEASMRSFFQGLRDTSK